MAKKNSIVVDGVTYYAKPEIDPLVSHALASWTWIKQDIAQVLKEATEDVEYYKAAGLSVSLAKAEGYFECATFIQSLVDQIKKAEQS